MSHSKKLIAQAHLERTERHGTVAAKLRALGDAELSAVLAAARPLFAGIGGTSLLLTVDEYPVFVKRVPLTDREHEPTRWQSTANLFALPAVCHYGMGSPGFGAWRELAAATIASDAALAGDCEHFPLLYHWRALPAPPPDALIEKHWSVLETDTKPWQGVPVVDDRLDAMRQASFHLVLFFEYVPTTLLSWIVERLKKGYEAANCAIAFIDQSLWPALDHMHQRGLFHFDAHFENIQTDGVRLYIGDFGLSVGPTFTLDEDEQKFLARHRSYDKRRASVALMHAIASVYFPSKPWDQNLRAYLDGKQDITLPAGVDAAIRQHGSAALAFIDIARAIPDGRATDFAFGSC